MNTTELINYYADLLIIQYIEQDRAYATIQATATPVLMPQVSVQTVSFSPAPSTGAFTLVYDGTPTASINWNDTASTIQGYLQAISGLSLVTVTGAIATGLTITFTGVTPPAFILTIGADTLDSTITIAEIDETLPLAIQNAFNLIGDNLAVGAQLDVLGKYAGVTRTAQGFTQQITLNDQDFLSLIKIVTLPNNKGSSDADIVGLLWDFFPGQIFLFDRQTMEFDYYIDSDVGSEQLLEVFIVEGFLPKPMGVRIRLIIYAPILIFFGYRTYQAPGFNVVPYNSYANYHMDWPWLTYQDAVII